MEGKSIYVAAIDVGTTKIVALLGKRNENNKLEIVEFVRSDSKGIRRGEVLNPEEVSRVIRNVIEELKQQTKTIFDEVFVGISGQHIRIVKDRKGFNRPFCDNSITAEDIEMLKREAQNIALDEGKEIIRILPQNYIVDNEHDISDPRGMLGRRLEANFNIVVGSMDSIKRIRRSVGQADLVVKDIILEPLASAEAVLHDEEREAGVAMVDIGGGTTDVAIFHDKVLRHSAVIPFGGYVVTKDIREICGLMEQVAEDLKVQFGMAFGNAVKEDKTIVIPAKIRGRSPKEISVRMLANIIQARMEEIIDAIMFEIENSGYAEKLGYGIVITGGGAMLNKLSELFSSRTGKEVRIGYPGEHLIGESDNINEPCYATGVGLLMKGFEYMDENSTEMNGVRFQDIIPVIEEITIQKPEIEEKLVEAEMNVEEKKSRKGTWFNDFKDTINRYFDAEPESHMK